MAIERADPAGPAPSPGPGPTDARGLADPPGLLEIGLGFARVAALAFGGVLPWARYVVVERKRWIGADEFTDMLSVAQLIPGPNILNLAVAIGGRFRGVPGALAAVAGLLGLPVAIVLGLATLYARFATVPAVNGALEGMAAAAAGLVIAMAAKIGEPVLRRRFALAAPVALGVFGAIALLRWPLWPVILAAAPLAIALGWRRP